MTTERQQMERGFTTPDGGVDVLRMAKVLSPEEFRAYIKVSRLERAMQRPFMKPGRFNA